MAAYDRKPVHISKPTEIEMAFTEAIEREFGKGNVEVAILHTSEDVEEIKCPVGQECNSCPSRPYCRANTDGEIPF